MRNISLQVHPALVRLAATHVAQFIFEKTIGGSCSYPMLLASVYRIDVDEGDISLHQFLDHFKNKYGLEVSMISCGVSILYSAFMTSKKKLEERLPMRYVAHVLFVYVLHFIN
jgi:hypothetical protein